MSNLGIKGFTGNAGGLKQHPLDSLPANPFIAGIPLSRTRRLVGHPSAGNVLRRRSPPFRRLNREKLVTRSTLGTGASPGEGNRGPFGLGTTRLKRIIQTGQTEFLSRFNTSRKNFPSKIFLLLLGYYAANALATILGQTGDWDVLAAGILVAVIEGIGYLMYRMPPVLGGRGKELVVFVNYFKSGFSFGLFVDAFKLGS